MKRIVALALTAVMSLGLLVGCGNTEDNMNDDKNLSGVKAPEETFVVGLDDSFPPMGFKDDNGELVGFDIDLARAVADEMGMKVEFKPQDWDGILLSLNKGDIDAIWNGFTISESRKKEVAFTDPYLKNSQILIVKEDSPIKNRDELKGKVLGIQLGSTAQEALDKHAEFKDSLKDVKSYSNNVEALLDLDAGRVDSVLLDEIVARYFMTKKDGQYKILEGDLGKEEYGVGVRKEDTEFLKKLNDALDKVKNSEKGKEISKKWFKADILAK